ncbi:MULTISPECIES: PilZ domain-containing protein [Methylotenera]|jgi:type IV pilus assembly protein PilZ|uniref:Type IV pilus assembly PilZ n=1 Tax=Methylotenera versatilis (strain 301) TaxID=666681 RepID=D7DI47_METV0|nr:MULTISPECIES: PilZ domain-containing protein [Methylotenera]ADI29732.1 type IV pilus assembly PilZ [Methylotenera versatilis 301]MBX9705631.1 PilZ domain-containing protein [Gammaproteobacteria bacterium]MDI1361720.1 PilZ domain-containing protein [Methylotenera sp.]
MAEDLAENTNNIPKPGVLSLAIKEKVALYAAYMPYVKGGGLFIPTNKPFKIGEEVFMLLSLIDDPMKLKVVGHVVWVTPAAQAGRPQGVGVQFSDKDGGIEAKNKIEGLLGSALKSSRATHTM